MRNKTNNSKGGNASRPSAGGPKGFGKSDGGGRSFKRAKPETESRFSKPSIKKSSLKFSGNSENRGPSTRPSFDHEKPREDRPRFDKPDFKKYGSDKRNSDSPRPFRREGDASGAPFKKDFGRSDSDRGARPYKPREEFRSDDRRPSGDRPERPRFDRDHNQEGFKPRGERPARPFDRNDGDRPARSFDRREGDRPARSFDRPDSDRPARPFNRTEGDRPTRSSDRTEGDRPARSFDRTEGDRPARSFDRREGDRPARSFDRDRTSSDRPARPFNRTEGDRPARSFERREGERPARSFDRADDRPAFKKKDDREGAEGQEIRNEDRSGLERRVGRFESAPRYNLSQYEKKEVSKKKDDNYEIRLNRYIANAGICSRREADDLISSGQISVNGKTITEMGYKVKPTDVVKYGKKALNPEKMVYILINKPKDYITTTDDPEERKTVLDLIQGACSERVYPVGRLDRNTTGLLLLTNDGELAEKLTHPSSGIKKIYQAEIDKPITTEDFETLQHGVELEDGFIRPDEVGIVTPDAMVVGLEIHSGRNRIVRRMFEHLGYEVQKLDRTVFAGLNKKDLPRGKWRFLTEKEVIKLKFLL